MTINNKVSLREKRLDDAAVDYAWKTDAKLAQLDAAPVLSTVFQQYLAGYARELRYPSPNREQFAIETPDGKHIGNCTYYGIDEAKGEAELGIMIGNHNYWDKGYGASAVSALVRHIFQHTRLTRIHLKTLVSNKRAQKCFAKCGFTPCGHLNCNGYDFILMELRRKSQNSRKS
jgi:RimJ/RimL family protein N-acetyltransferase